MPFRIYQKFTRSLREDGMLVSSSGFLVRTMLGRIDFSRPLAILEIGSGKGAFTREIIRRMHPDTQLDVVDTNAAYNAWIERLIADNPDRTIHLHNTCITALLREPDHYDVIVSSLPLKNFENRYDHNGYLHSVIRALRDALRVGGLYLQYQYFLSNKDDIEQIFGKHMDGVDFVPLNILPAFVYRMTK